MSDDLQQAAKAYEKATADYEAAAMRSDAGEQAQARATFDVAAEQYAQALSAHIRARRRAAPTFEQILRDPTQQLDPDLAILRSIAEYNAAPSATVGWMPVARSVGTDADG